MTSPHTSYLDYGHADSPFSTFWKKPRFWIGSGVALFALAFRGRTRLALLAAGGALASVQPRMRSMFSSHSTILLQCSPEEAFDFWNHSGNLPKFMRHVQSVQAMADGQFRWNLRTADGKPIDSLVEVVAQKPSHIEWRCSNSSTGLAGRIEFRAATAGRGTIVNASIQYPQAAIGAGYWAMRFFERNPTFLATQDLRRFKALVETGEIPTTAGQSHGPRTWGTALKRSLNPDRPSPSKQTLDISEQRRIA